eukprot:TRINITY_DN18696_c0_g1_i1.p1 TRINITY_DN18696_c0_g1~~TRINITY_DN18696_c0_g1_i1.p1  ORF type:complete len:401 (-),score=162.41 TRINITY_DN18696_c0_g1_i1:174-1376(-)
MGADGASPAGKEQVLVAALPGDSSPEVHIAVLTPEGGALSLREAFLQDGGGVKLGKQRTVSLANAAEVKCPGGGEVTVYGTRGDVIVQLHLESEEDTTEWVKLLKATIRGAKAIDAGDEPPPAGAEGAEGEEELVLLKARSQQLQNRIGSLEAVAQKRDGQLQKMLQRLEDSMQMLSAVQDMCDQQKSVLAAQRHAIQELKTDCGLAAEEASTAASASSPGAAGGSGGRAATVSTATQAEAEEDDDDAEDTEGPVINSTEEMLALLKQADEMQRALQSLKGGVASMAPPPPRREGASAAGAGALRAPASSPIAEEDEEDDEEDDEEPDDEETEALNGQLNALEAEKERFEGLLRDSQSEHDGLLDRLNGMRSLMSALGINLDDLTAMGEDEDDEDDEDAE